LVGTGRFSCETINSRVICSLYSALDPPDSITIGEFWYNEKYGRLPLDKSRNPFTCGISNKTYTNAEMKERSELLARSLAKRMGWRANEDTPWDKVVGVFAFNSVS
jgi:hypothetical protein